MLIIDFESYHPTNRLQRYYLGVGADRLLLNDVCRCFIVKVVLEL